MIKIAQTIAQKFEHVRVDLYDIKGKIFIGELTFTPEGEIMNYFTNEGVEAAGHKKKGIISISEICRFDSYIVC